MSVWQIALSVAWFLLLGCSGENQASGGSSVETENVITAQVKNPQGKPVASAKVQIRPTWFLADTELDSLTSLFVQNVQTDSDGNFECYNLPQGRYAIRVMYGSLGAVWEYNHYSTTKSSDLPPIILSELGKITGFVNLPENVTSALVQIYGLEREIQTDGKGYFEFDSIPAGTFHIRAVLPDSASNLAESFVLVRSGYTANMGTLPEPSFSVEDPLVWRYSTKMDVDSLVSDWMLPVPSSTVVVIRLDSTSFDFSQAMPSGNDIRFYDDAGSPLAYQRGLWDSQSRRGLLRVLIPSTKKIQQIEMRWGCSGAIDRSTDSIWEGVSDSLKLELYSVLVGDFEKQSKQTTLPSPIASTYWYIFPFDSTVTYSPANWIEGIGPAGDGRKGNALHLTYMAEDFKWVFIGASLDSIPKSFAAMDSVVFWVKGDGVYSFALDYIGDTGGKTIYNDTLTSEWTKKCITPDMFDPPDQIGGNIGWEAVKDSITNLTIFFAGGTEFWIDDVRIYGLNRDDLK